MSEAAVSVTLPHLAHEELPPSGITEHKCQSSGHSTDLMVCKYTNSYMQAHTYRLNDTKNTCAVSLPCHEVTLWSVQIKMQNQLALVHIKYHMHSY